MRACGCCVSGWGSPWGRVPGAHGEGQLSRVSTSSCGRGRGPGLIVTLSNLG